MYNQKTSLIRLDFGTNTKVNDKIYTFYRDKFFNHFTHIHCPSSFIANELKKHGYTANLHVISNGISSDFHYLKKEKTGALKNTFVITMIGRYSNEKRQDLLIEAVRKCKYENNIQIVLAGKGLNEEKYIKMGKNLTNPPILKFFAKEELLELLSMTDLYTHCADAEIEAISCIEAFACGIVPIISNSPKSATPQFAIDERSLFEAGNSSDLARKIEYWIEHETQRKQMEREYATKAEDYRMEKSMEKIEEMFQDAINELRN